MAPETTGTLDGDNRILTGENPGESCMVQNATVSSNIDNVKSIYESSLIWPQYDVIISNTDQIATGHIESEGKLSRGEVIGHFS